MGLHIGYKCKCQQNLISVALISHCRDAVADSKKLSRMDTLLLQDYLS